MSDHGLFPSKEGQQGAANGQDSWVFFRDAQGFRRPDGGSRAGFTSLRPPPPSSFETSALLLKTLAVGRRQQSESIEVALDME